MQIYKIAKNMNNIGLGTMFGYLYRHTEHMRFLELEDTRFSVYMSKSHNHLITGHFTVPGAVKEANLENVR